MHNRLKYPVLRYQNETMNLNDSRGTPSDATIEGPGAEHMKSQALGKSRNNYELITGGWDNTVQFWDLRQPYAVRKITGVHMAGEGIDISVSGKEILTAAFQKANQLALWDYGSGRCISVLEPDVYNSKLYCGKFVTKDFVVTGGTDPNLVRIVDLQTTGTAAAMNFLPGAVYSFDAGQVRKKDVPSTINKDIISTRAKSDASSIPRIGFVSSRRLYQIELY
ncbi:unnamed protein product [Acanthoscelides obtectus]|uniref:Uncharacterized protein n=1 Tax=Acanthoscelides obtectus TaxID=200917 RepID=A0A9P0K0D1_ACAOB|nr:unnamed protein product [Acanthoscelides obtectus]CAK1669606.1 hypothetical protein AOBTE_LOCUS27101 [Acanthoscelides obtectus]